MLETDGGNMDIVSDTSNATLYRILKRGAPEYVMRSTKITKEAANALPDSLFADGFNRRYPVDSKADTWLAAAYLSMTPESECGGAERAAVKEAVDKAASLYGILDDVKEIVSKIEKPAEKKAAAPDDSCYGWPSERKYPMFDMEGAEKASEYFAENAYKYPPAVRHEIAGNIFRKCAEFGVEPARTVRVEARIGLGMPDKIASAILDRAYACGGTDDEDRLAAKLCDIGMSILSFRGNQDEFAKIAMDIASDLEELDMTKGFHRQYGTRFEPPSEVFFGISPKEAEHTVSDTVFMKGMPFSAEKLAELPEDVFTDALGDAFGKAVRSASGGIDAVKLASEIKALPAEERNALCDSIVERTA